MKYKLYILVLLYSFFLFPESVYGIGERTIILGSDASWNLVEKRQGIIEAPQIRPYPVFVLSSNRNPSARVVSAGSRVVATETALLDLSLSFDEGHPLRFADSQGRYDVIVSPMLSSVSAPWSRAGAGAALFNGQNGDEPIVLRPRENALFAPGSHVRDFSIEFWLFPQNLGNGEQILLWNSSKPDGRGGFVHQRINCFSSRNRLYWTFTNFFFSPGGDNSKALSFSGPLLLPRTWSHHLIRFDADLGILEYLVNGKVEVVEYSTSTGREGGEVFTPLIGENCRLVLGSRFSGMMDEFRIYRCFLEIPVLSKYSGRGGRVETQTLDLGYVNSRVLKIEAFGGRTHASRNEYVGNGKLSFPDHAAMNFFIRASNHPYRWMDAHWVPVNPGTELEVRGRYIQLAVDFYPSWDGETSPYLSELRVIYQAAEPPLPPTRIIATAKDGAVELSWRASVSRNTEGYLVFYGTASGEYLDQASPIDAGNLTSIRINGLDNGTLYFFAIAAYNNPGVSNIGEFSREVAARPLRMIE
jgi:hypothetical protein